MIDNPQKTPMLVFAVGGRLGSGCSFVRDWISHCLSTFDYSVEIIDVTKTFLENAHEYLDDDHSEDTAEEKVDGNVELNPAGKRVRRLQRNGNLLRCSLGDDVIAALCITEVIGPHLKKTKSFEEKSRLAFIIDSLKHPEEVRLLRRVFGDAFFMVGVVSSDKVRKDRLRERKDYDDAMFDLLSSIDANEQGQDHGQKTIDAVTEADYFFANDFATKAKIQNEAERLMRLIFGIEIQSPRKEEIGMHSAFKAAKQSACLSRQVGAAIFDSNNSILATGHNDVPQFGGGLYSPESTRDERCYARGGKCYNDQEKSLIVGSLVDGLVDAGIVEDNDESKNQARKSIQRSRVKHLIEFSRAVHAEMEAIISVARSGHSGLLLGTLYCTTFPCHNCAKHIIDAGISRVVYLEPYEKSLARKLHGDAINPPNAEKQTDKVSFDLYGGVAPSRFDQFFTASEKRKSDDRGVFIDLDRGRSELPPRNQQEKEVIQSRIDHVVKRMTELVDRKE